MNNTIDPTLLVPRTCTLDGDQNRGRVSRPLEDFRDVQAYVLLGDPGAGKTKSFEHEAAATGGHYIRARSFASLDPSPELTSKTLFIDGLDEMRASGGDGRTPLDHVRHHLFRLGQPRFRISCREADWYGDSDRVALLEAAPGGSLAVLHLNPLNDSDILLLLKRKFAIADADEFVQQADFHRLTNLLRNPQALGMLVNAVGGSTWPDSRASTYDLACRQLIREANQEHRTAKRHTAPTHEALLEANGFLCAIQLLSGIAGFSLDDDAADDQHILWHELILSHQLPLPDALASGLFQRDDREQQRIPIHRSIAEFIGARYLAKLIDEGGLPIGRIIALLTSEDGGIAPDLRGLSAWLAVHCCTARAELVDRDPLGVVLYGDVRSFSTDNKRRVLGALRDEAESYAHFRFEDWTAAPFGALATPDMIPLFLEILSSPSRVESDIALLECALDSLRYGPPPLELTTINNKSRLYALLDTTARDTSYPTHIRQTALKILLRDLPNNASYLVCFAKDVNAGAIVDEDDQLLGLLLLKLFPQYIQAEELLDFLHQEKRESLIGDYHIFWNLYLPDITPDDLLPILLDELAKRIPMLQAELDPLKTERMVGGLLTRALETHGDKLEKTRLYDWLGTGLNEYGEPRIGSEHANRVSTWLAEHSGRYKAVLLAAIDRCSGDDDVETCLYESFFRLYDAEPPSDIIPWYLERAIVETCSEIKRYFFSHAVKQLIREGGEGDLTTDALDYLSPVIKVDPELESYLLPFVFCDINDWRRDNEARRRKRMMERERQKTDRQDHFQKHLKSILEGNVHPAILNNLANAYLNLFIDVQGETPRERLMDFLGGNEKLVEAAYVGFRLSLERNDLPDVSEIVDLETKGRMHYIRQPCLVGMEEFYSNDPKAALQLNDAVLRKLIAFRFTWGVDMNEQWFTALVMQRPDLVTEVFLSYARVLLRKGREHIGYPCQV